jgi:hypothetical protein
MERETDHAFDSDTLQYLYAKTLYALRESRKAMLRQYGLASEAALLELISAGSIAEHPAYEHYLGALIIEQTRNHIRAQATEQLGGGVAIAGVEASVHLVLQEHIEQHYADRLSGPVQLAQDALLASFDTGLMVELRYFSVDEYSISWAWGDAQLRIDTAPTHADCASFPHHLHDADGELRADVVTVPGTPYCSNITHLIDLLLVDPLLESARADLGNSKQTILLNLESKS